MKLKGHDEVSIAKDAQMDGRKADAAYLATWGVAWTPIPTCGGEAYFPTHDEIDAVQSKSNAPSTMLRTNLAKGTR